MLRNGHKDFPRSSGLKLSIEDAAEAVAENTAYTAMYCRDNISTPIDVSWTCFELGWDHRHLVLVDNLELRDSETGELVMKYPQPGGGSRSMSCNGGDQLAASCRNCRRKRRKRLS